MAFHDFPVRRQLGQDPLSAGSETHPTLLDFIDFHDFWKSTFEDSTLRGDKPELLDRFSNPDTEKVSETRDLAILIVFIRNLFG